MPTAQEYLQKLSITQLQALLREECDGRGSLPVEAILNICEILSERDLKYPKVKDMILHLCKDFLVQIQSYCFFRTQSLPCAKGGGKLEHSDNLAEGLFKNVTNSPKI